MQIRGCRGRGWGLSGGTRKFRNCTEVVVALHCECAEYASELFTLKWSILCYMNFT